MPISEWFEKIGARRYKSRPNEIPSAGLRTLFRCSPADLVAALGPRTASGDGYKSTRYWFFCGKQGSPMDEGLTPRVWFWVYDDLEEAEDRGLSRREFWKSTEPVLFKIGGTGSEVDMWQVVRFLQGKVDEARKKRTREQEAEVALSALSPNERRNVLRRFMAQDRKIA